MRKRSMRAPHPVLVAVVVIAAAALSWARRGAAAEAAVGAPTALPSDEAPSPAAPQAPGAGPITVYPGGRLQIDGGFFPRQTPTSGVFIRRARLELSGWLGPWFYFDLSGDFAPGPSAGALVAPSALPAADDYLAFAPLGERLIVQAGQFDAPFTFENQTSDAFTDFIERSMTARTLGAPRNKEVGAMVQGRIAGRRVTYAAGLFDGEGPGFRNADNQADAVGRVTFIPFAARGGALERASVGVSAWHGSHVQGPDAPVQATPGGAVFFSPSWTTGDPTASTVALREQGPVAALAGEVNLPLSQRFGLRAELVWKRQSLAEIDMTTASAAAGNAKLTGITGYGEAWWWALGDDRLLPAPGHELPRPRDAAGPELGSGVMLAVKGEVLNESLTSDTPVLGDPEIGTTRVASFSAAANGWWGPLVRASLNYVLNVWGGTAPEIVALVAQARTEQELLLRFAMAM
jgi:phosphate-selective porin